jgi:hypothetical protein
MTQKKNLAREPKTKTDKEKFIERRREHTEGVEICPECGGVLWIIDRAKRCGDCRCRF